MPDDVENVLGLPNKCPVCGGTEVVKFDIGPGKTGPGFYSAIAIQFVKNVRYELVVCAKDGTQYLRVWKKPEGV